MVSTFVVVSIVLRVLVVCTVAAVVVVVSADGEVRGDISEVELVVGSAHVV